MVQKVPNNNNKTRPANLRQRLLKASRVINNAIVTGLQQRGFEQLRSTHTALLSNLDLDGSNLTTVAQRAGMSKQAMGRLAEQLITDQYITRTQDKNDQRAIKLKFTARGRDLMNQSFEVMSEIEKNCAKKIGQKHFNNMLHCLMEIEQLMKNLG